MPQPVATVLHPNAAPASAETPERAQGKAAKLIAEKARKGYTER